MIVDGFTSQKVCTLTGVPPSTLNYWVATGIVNPSIRGRGGRRATQWWTLTDLVAVRAVKALRDAGCPLQTLRRAQAVITSSWKEGLGDAVLHWDGVDVLRVGEMGEVQSTVRHPGQGVLHLVAVPIGRWQTDLARETETVDVERLQALARARASRRTTPWQAAVDQANGS